MYRRRAVLVLLMAGALASGCGGDDDAQPTTTSTPRSTSTTSRVLSASECAGAVQTGVSSIDMTTVDVSDGISDAEVASVGAQLDGIEARVPDLMASGSCMQQLADPTVAENGVRFAKWDALAVLSLVPGIETRGAWGPAVAAYERLAASTP